MTVVGIGVGTGVGWVAGGWIQIGNCISNLPRSTRESQEKVFRKLLAGGNQIGVHVLYPTWVNSIAEGNKCLGGVEQASDPPPIVG